MRRRRSSANRIIWLITAIVLGLISYYGRQLPHNAPRSGNIPAPTSFTGKVVAITDGDTIRVMYKGQEQKIRLWGVDAPEKTQAYGTAARNFTGDMVFGKTVTVDVRDTDRYGRWVGWITAPDGKVLNLELVQNGYAWWYRQYAPYATDLADAQDSAQNARRGLWKDKNPEAPWDYRRQERQRRMRY